jgi:hypothetical protein
MSYTSIEQIKNDYVGKRVIITEANHPWKGELGIFKDIDIVMGKPAVKIELIEQCGHECYVFSGGRGIKVIK